MEVDFRLGKSPLLLIIDQLKSLNLITSKFIYRFMSLEVTKTGFL